MSLIRRVIRNYLGFFQSLLLRRKKHERRDGNPFIYPLF